MGKLGQRVISYSIVPLVMTISACSAIYQRVVATSRHPGEQIATTPDKVWQELNCAKRERPFVQVELKPGRWIVDSFFTLPPESPFGVYALEVSFEIPHGQPHKQVRSFVVSDA